MCDLIRTIPDLSDDDDNCSDAFSENDDSGRQFDMQFEFDASLMSVEESNSRQKSVASAAVSNSTAHNQTMKDLIAKFRPKLSAQKSEIEEGDVKKNSDILESILPSSSKVPPAAQNPKVQQVGVSKKRQELLINSTAKFFQDLNLSKPLLRAINDLRWDNPTRVQVAVIPKALQGKDLLVNAVTGSGKTAAFILPVLDRLLLASKQLQGTRIVVLVPTRELAAQCFQVAQEISKYAPHLTSALVVGGLSESAQAVALRAQPHLVIATPGRLLDHLMNSKSVAFDLLEVLILDEADRLLEMGFIEEIEQIVRMCPKNRQTMMFSATMTNMVDQLAALALKDPVQINVDPISSLVERLTQEFIRVRQQQDSETRRLATVIALAQRTFKSQTIVFFPTKVMAHKAMIIFGLLGLSAAELHGNLTQEQRLDALRQFSERECDFLLCTDLASRGLDIKGIQTVINYSTPKIETYVHRVGRTARAGLEGHAVTLIGDADHKVLAEILKRAPTQVKRRKIPNEVIENLCQKILSLQSSVDEILEQEKIEKDARVAEMEMNKTKNMMLYEAEIQARPAKSWFLTAAEKLKLKEQSKNGIRQEEEVLSKSSLAREEKKQKIVQKKLEELKKQNNERNEAFGLQKRDAKRARKETRLRQLAKEEVVKPRRETFVEDYDPDSFENRYKDVNFENEDNEETSSRLSKKRKRVTGKFKSKKRYKRH